MRTSVSVAAVDIGASSGRVMLAQVGTDVLELSQAHRFANHPVSVRGMLRWDILALHRGVLDGLRIVAQQVDRLDALGIDTWAGDYGLLDASGELLGNPVHYRDHRTDGVMAALLERIPAAVLHATTGVQFLPFNQLYQLLAAQGTPQLAVAETLLLVPDLLVYWLTGVVAAEATNASVTQLVDVRTGTWATELMERVGIDPCLFPPIVQPGEVYGPVLPSVLDDVGLPAPVPVVAVGSHDTASAVVGVPAVTPRFGYVSCGTWSLVGLELDAPILSDASRDAGFGNELGVDGSVRFLHNVMGLWLLQESIRTWESSGTTVELASLLRRAAALPAFAAVVDPDDPVFLPPGNMPARIATVCERTGQRPPREPAAVVRCVLDSLALAYRRTLRRAQELAATTLEVVHVVGGGCRNALLCQLTADACELPVIAGPVEATALGNALVQARCLGALDGGLETMRGLLVATQPLQRYEPRARPGAWTAAERRLWADAGAM